MGKGGRVASTQKVFDSGKDNAETTSTVKKYSWAEVKKHVVPEDAWIVHNNKVYDVSDWYEHPGGGVIFTHAGDDMTDIFAAFHATGSYKFLRRFYIGDLIPETVEHKDEKQLAFEQAYRDLRNKFIMMGFFKSNKLFYIYKQVSNMVLWATSCAMVYYSSSTLVHIASALLMALFWQQCGWLAHDFLHHQVFTKREYGDYAGLFWGNLMQGFSVQWWKNKHNGHHATPNLHNTSVHTQDGDPDIDTMPLLAWSIKQAQSFREFSKSGSDSPFVQFAIKYQAWTYFPILMLARLSWLNESFKTAYRLGAATENAKLEMERKGLQYPIAEKVLLAIFHSWTFVVSSGFGRWSLPYSFAYYMIHTTSAGLLLALVTGLGHNGMAVYDAETRPDFWKLQVTTSRNIIGGHGIPQWFVDWLCGGLQLQVDHHLFPMMPRHHLPRAHEFVKSFCKEWDVSYHEADLIDGNREVVQHLQKVSDEFLIEMITEFPGM